MGTQALIRDSKGWFLISAIRALKINRLTRARDGPARLPLNLIAARHPTSKDRCLRWWLRWPSCLPLTSKRALAPNLPNFEVAIASLGVLSPTTPRMYPFRHFFPGTQKSRDQKSLTHSKSVNILKADIQGFPTVPISTYKIPQLCFGATVFCHVSIYVISEVHVVPRVRRP
eukprot:SAG11_NODE_1889_length_4112_cov_19.726888_4_plen_172_part_00